MNKTAIDWTDLSWNPITGCRNGCSFCYARRLIARQGIDFEPRFHPERLDQPLAKQKPKRIFAGSMCDFFSDGVQPVWRDRVWSMMENCDWHTFIVLTKRPVRMRAYVADRYDHNDGFHGYAPNIWLGVSVTNQADADERIPLLLQTPAAKRIVSWEPALDEVDFARWLDSSYRCFVCGYTGFDFKWRRPAADQPVCPKCGEGTATGWANSDETATLDWFIAGALTGPGAVPPKREWIEQARKQCEAAGVAYFEKSSLKSITGRELIQQWPAE